MTFISFEVNKSHFLDTQSTTFFKDLSKRKVSLRKAAGWLTYNFYTFINFLFF